MTTPDTLIAWAVGLALVAIALLTVYVARLHKRLSDQDIRILAWQDSMRALYQATEWNLAQHPAGSPAMAPIAGAMTGFGDAIRNAFGPGERRP
jgi:hypothetical protein